MGETVIESLDFGNGGRVGKKPAQAGYTVRVGKEAKSSRLHGAQSVCKVQIFGQPRFLPYSDRVAGLIWLLRPTRTVWPA